MLEITPTPQFDLAERRNLVAEDVEMENPVLFHSSN